MPVIILWYLCCGASSDDDIIPSIYTGHTWKSDTQLSIDSPFCFRWHWHIWYDTNASNETIMLTPWCRVSDYGHVMLIIYTGHISKSDKLLLTDRSPQYHNWCCDAMVPAMAAKSCQWSTWVTHQNLISSCQMTAAFASADTGNCAMMQCWKWCHSARNDYDLMMTIYTGHTSKSHKQLLIGGTFCFPHFETL